MPVQVVTGATLMCTFGVAPSVFTVIPPNVTATTPAANILDFAPIANIKPFGMCTTPSNPTVASATAAALGVLTPMPCVPVTAAPWIPGCTKTMIRNAPALHNGCQCLCTWGRVITVTSPGQFKVQVT